MKKFILIALVFTGKLLLAQSNNFNNTTSLNCSLNTFWGLRDNGNSFLDLFQFKLQNDSIIYDGIISNNCPGYALAFCNNLNGGTISPTFYTDNYNAIQQQDSPIFYNNPSWISSGIADSFNLFHGGGYSNNIFFAGRKTTDFAPKYIVRYNGISLDTIYHTPPNNFISVLDIAADANNNVWFFTSNDTSFFANNLNVIDSNGSLLQQYNTNFDTEYSYGLCIIEDTLYIGFGSYNGISPHSMFSVLLIGSTASLNQQIYFPSIASSINFSDLASCNPGVPTGFKEIQKTTETIITLYPNPATDKITVGNIPANAKQLCITNSMGAVVWQQDLSPTPALPGGEGVKNERQLVVNTSRFAPGMYAVCVKTNKEVLVKKMVKL